MTPRCAGRVPVALAVSGRSEPTGVYAGMIRDREGQRGQRRQERTGRSGEEAAAEPAERGQHRGDTGDTGDTGLSRAQPELRVRDCGTGQLRASLGPGVVSQDLFE